MILTGSGTSGNVVAGNYIGVDATGTAPLGNSGTGVAVGSSAANNTIGGTAAGAGNVIANNGNSGVIVTGSVGNAIFRNAMYNNTSIGIDLANNLVTANDGAKTAGQPNLLMDFPVFTSATLSGTTLTVAGYVGSAPNQSTFADARVEVFKSDNDASGYGEGQTYLGFLTSDANGNFSGSLTVSGLVAGDRITGTATDGSSNTSEFGANVIVGGTANLVLTLTDNPDPAASGGDLLYKMLIVNNGPDTATGVVATNVLPASVTLFSATPSQGSCSGTTTVTCSVGSILDSGTASVDILVVTSTTGTITNNASVTAVESDPVPGNNTASATTSVVVGHLDRGAPDAIPPDPQFRGFHRHGGHAAHRVEQQQPVRGRGKLHRGAVGDPRHRHGGGGLPVLGRIGFHRRQPGHPQRHLAHRGPHLRGPVRAGPDELRLLRGVQGRHRPGAGHAQRELHLRQPHGGHGKSLLLLPGGSRGLVPDRGLPGHLVDGQDARPVRRVRSPAQWVDRDNLTGIYTTAPPEGKATYLVREGDPDAGGANERLVFNGTALSDALNPANNPYNSTINSLGVNNSYGVDLDTFNVSSYINSGDTLATMTLSAASDLVILNAVLLQVRSNIITGQVFEDVNYGGGAGRNLAAAVAGAPGLPSRGRGPWSNSTTPAELPAVDHDGCERPIRIRRPARRQLHRAGGR